MKGKKTTVFPGNNSVSGFASCYASGLAGMEQVYIIKGGPGTGKSSFMRRLGEDFLNSGCDVEFWRCSSDTDSLDGVVIPALSAAVIDGTAPHTMDPLYPGAKETILNFGDFWDEELLTKAKKDIISLTGRVSDAFSESYRHLAEAGACDDRLLAERKRRAEEFRVESFLAEVFGESSGTERHLFAAAVTPEGIVDHTFDLCRGYQRRFFLQGKRGLGQQRCLEAVLEAGRRRRLTTDVFHGPFRKEEIRAVAFPDESVVVAAAENVPPKELRESDRVLPFTAKSPSLRERQTEKDRDEALAAAVAELAKAHMLHDDLEGFYVAAMDFDALEELRERTRQKILKRAAKA
ncbi:MAG: hypothetical protein ACOX8R_09385 [Bacillota bacterium]|jgi:hypothetical protein